MASYWSNVRGVGEDALLSLGVTLALLAFYQAMRPESRHSANVGSWLLFTLGMMIATLSKGVLGLALPGIVIFSYLMCESLIEKRFTLRNWLRPALLHWCWRRVQISPRATMAVATLIKPAILAPLT